MLILRESSELQENKAMFEDDKVLGLYYADNIESVKAKFLDTEKGKQLNKVDYWRVLALPLKEYKHDNTGLIYGFDDTKPLGIAEI